MEVTEAMLNQLSARISELESIVTEHLGPVTGLSVTGLPHPNQRINSLIGGLIKLSHLAPDYPEDGNIWYDPDTDDFKGTLASAEVDFITDAHVSWIDLTDAGVTTLHSHAGVELKTSGGGYYLIPAGPAAGTAAVDSATDNTYGSWVEMRAAAGNALFIVGVTVRANTSPGTTGDYVQLDIGTGAAASETSVSELYFADIINGGQHIELPFPIPVAASTRIVVRVADSETVANTYEVTLQVIDQADLVSI